MAISLGAPPPSSSMHPSAFHGFRADCLAHPSFRSSPCSPNLPASPSSSTSSPFPSFSGFSRRLRGYEKVQQCREARPWREKRVFAVRGGMLEEVANTRIATRDGREILAFVAKPEVVDADRKLPVVILVHEFYGLTPEICGKADAISKEVECMVIAPDTYRGESTSFIPKAIFLALSTPQERVNIDLDEVLAWAATTPGADTSRVGLVGFCYGGGKVIAYSTSYQKAKATIVIYGKPILDSDALRSIKGRVLGIYGDRDIQFPKKMVMGFEEALDKAGVTNTISIYEGQGHAFWSDMDQVAHDGPQRKAWLEVTKVLKDTLFP